MGKPTKICVIGGGIIGLSSAYQLAVSHPGCEITIFAESLTPNTVSNHSFGSIWIPHSTVLEAYTSVHDYQRTIKTFNHCCDIIQKYPELATRMGFALNDGYHLFDAKQGVPEKYSGVFMKTSPNFRKSDINDEMCLKLTKNGSKYDKLFNRKGVCPDDVIVYQYNIIAIDCDIYLQWLTNEMKEMARRKHISKFEISKIKIHSFDELQHDQFDLVINCAGLGARELCKDKKMVPIRGQYLVCKRPHKESPFMACSHDKGIFVFPVTNRVLIGPMFQPNREDTAINERDTLELISRARDLWPEVEDHLITVDAAIRPARVKGCRIESEIIQTSGGKKMIVIHNYGHGPKGIILHWGSAIEITTLSKQFTCHHKL